MQITEIETWSVDIGNVLLWNLPDKQKSAKLTLPETVSCLEEVPGAFQGLQFLIDRVGADRVWILSKAAPLQEAVSRLALESKFPIVSTLGFKQDHLKFCLEKRDKAPIIKELGIQGHIDDRGEVIASIQQSIACPIWFRPENWDYQLWRDRVTYRAILVKNWQQILEMFKE